MAGRPFCLRIPRLPRARARRPRRPQRGRLQAKAKAKGKAKAKAAQSKAGTSKGKGKDKDNTASTGVKRKFNIPFPGKPKKWVEVQEFGKYKIYTDMKKKAWRVMVVGHKNDKSYGWQTDAKAAWEQMASDLSNGSIGVNWK